ncbi:hypothetical protein AAL_03289 [Moelleriella libera RCEF 2490]|uniref:Uncharacterized protein n=1 Tax=Moelleriella libera RCEF 2490 TaxID=1081109 RepID=A0A168D3X8_9HYPO|nr:hypothetical protein AAL_03289 [Moelleriella libera RCEF 2490]
MPLEQTVTIVNNSGKIISTGKQLFSIFKEAKASYSEKKAEIKGLRRAETFDASRSIRGAESHRRSRGDGRHGAYEPEHYTEYDYGRNPEYHDGRRRSFDVYSEASSRRRRRVPASSQSGPYQQGSRSRPALTESNLKTLSEVSSTAPSRAPPTSYRSPYVETVPRDMAVSKLDLAQSDARSTAETEWRRGAALPRRRSESEIARRQRTKSEEIDMNLAYGNIPPDLEFRVDLDPARADEYKANVLVRRVEGLLDEAHCVQHSATSIIKHLQRQPDAAAAVALTLAELSSVVGKMSPAFLGFLKSGSPAVFSLLASPQFLIGTGIAVVGLTVVMFGGWKIVKRVREQHAAREALAWDDGVPADRPAPMRTQSDLGGNVDEALIVDEELSTIETWRRGIMPPGADNESADVELMTPEAERAQRERHHHHHHLKNNDDAAAAADVRSTRSARTTRTSGTKTTSACFSSSRDAAGEQKPRNEDDDDGRERERRKGKSSRGQPTAETVRGGDSELGSRRRENKPHHQQGGERGRRREREPKMIEDGRRSQGAELVYRPKASNHGENMLKALFKNKRKERDSRTDMVLA